MNLSTEISEVGEVGAWLLILLMPFVTICLWRAYQQKKQKVRRSNLLERELKKLHPDSEWDDIKDLLRTAGISVSYTPDQVTGTYVVTCKFNHLYNRITEEVLALASFWLITTWDNTQRRNRHTVVDAIVWELHQKDNRWKYSFVRFAKMISACSSSDHYQDEQDLLNRLSLAHYNFCLFKKEMAKQNAEAIVVNQKGAERLAFQQAFKERSKSPATADSSQLREEE